MKNTSIFLLFAMIASLNFATAQTSNTPEQRPQFPGGDKALMLYLAENLKYPKTAQESSIEGKVLIRFLVDKTGKVSDVKVLRGIGGGCDEEAVRVVKNLPDFKPAMQDGVPVKTFYNIPVFFKLDNNEREIIKIAAPDGKDSIYIKPTLEPSYKKMTDMELTKFLSKKVKSNNLGAEKGKEVYVTINFLVNKDGKVADYEITRQSVNSGKIEEEALRVAKMITQMEPAVYNNEKVRAFKSILITLK